MKDLREMERLLGIERNVPPSYTQRDAHHLTVKRLSVSKKWKSLFQRQRVT